MNSYPIMASLGLVILVVAGVIAAVFVIKKMWKKPTPNIEVAAAASEMDASNPRNGP